jgi:hypothetical protein
VDDPALSLVLEECLICLGDGEDPADIAGRYPDLSDTLLPLLRVAAQLREEAEDAFDDPAEFLQQLGEFLYHKVDGDPDT